MASLALDLIQLERARQVSKGWTAEHDDLHADGEIALAAACYALTSRVEIEGVPRMINALWPWEREAFQPRGGGGITDLVRAGALIVAEIERRLRIEESDDLPW